MNENSNPNPAEQLTSESAAINVSPSPETANQPAVYVIFDKSDLENAGRVEERVLEAGCTLFSSRDYLEPSLNGDSDADAAALHREYLAQCDGVIIYWNEAPLIWIRKNIADILASKAQREEKFFIQTVFCEGESELKTQIHSASEMPVLNDYAELSDLLARLWCKHIKPYPGLRPFEYKENYLFFGREGKAQEIALRLQDSNFVAVVGTSGSGKSSVVRAGLLPLLYGGLLYKSGSNWRISIMRPEETPIRNLAESLVYPVDFESEESRPILRDETHIGITEAILRRSGVGLLDFINNPVNKFTKDENLLIVVDQFEELFRFKGTSAGGYSEEAAAFVKLLLEAARDKESRIFVVITMRSDFLGDCAEFQGLPEAINKGQYLIPQMTRDQLRESIESPVLVGGAEISPALVNRILNDLDDDQSRTLNARDRMVRDYLPVMQHALMRTWDCWKKEADLNKPIDIEHYEEIGGIKSALSKHADEAYGELSEKQKFIAEKMFKCLTETDAENREIRRPARIEEIRDIIGVNEQEIFDVIEIFRREGRTFLMPSFNVPLTKNTKIDISHESLIRNWETLKGWVKTEAESAWLFRRISSDAKLLTKYRERNASVLSAEEIERDSKDFLWRGIELKDALNWRDTFKPNVAWTSRYQRLTEREKQELAELARTAPEQETEKRKEFMHRHFDEMQEFLSASALYEEEQRIRLERYRQAQLAVEREKALAAEQLAEAEREKVEELSVLTRSLKEQRESLQRQKRNLIIAVSFSLFLMLISIISSFFAWANYNSAKAAQIEADKQKDIALTERNNAEEQRKIALGERNNADEQKRIAENERDNVAEQKREVEKQKQNVETERNNAQNQEKIANEQQQRAEENEKEALNQKQKAENLTIQVQQKADRELMALTKEKEALEKLDSERQLGKFNSDGLFALENYDYDEAIKNFNKLLPDNSNNLYQGKIESKDKVKNEWWAKYNLAKTYQQKVDFEQTVTSFKNALETLSKAEQGITKSINPAEVPQVNFLFASYSSSPIQVSNVDIDNYKIITLRKFAQFYRFCALTPEKCFKINTNNQIDASPAGVSPRSADSVEQRGSLTDTNNNLKRELNESAVKQYAELVKISRVKTPKNPRDAFYKADVQKELADVYKDLNKFKEAVENYEGALKTYETDTTRDLLSFSLMKDLLGAMILLRVKESDFDSTKTEKIARGIIDRTEALLLSESSPVKKNKIELLYNKTIGTTYNDLSAIYRDPKLTGVFQEKLENLRAKAGKNNLIKEVVDNFQYVSLENSYYESRESLTPEQEPVWRELSTAVEILRELYEKSETLSEVGRLIQSLEYADTTGFYNFQALADAYIDNNECQKAFDLSPKIVEESNTNPLGYKKQLADFYAQSLHDPTNAAKFYDEWTAVFKEKASAGEVDLDSGYINYFIDIGEFYYIQGEYNKAQEAFARNLEYFENTKSSLNDLSKAQTSLGRLYVDILNTRASELSKNKNVDKIIEEYNKSLTGVQKWVKDQKLREQNNKNQPPTSSNTNVSNVQNANVSVNTNSLVTKSNRIQKTTANRAVNTAQIGPFETFDTDYSYYFSPLYSKAGVYEAYLRVRLADLYLSKGGNENVQIAGKLLNDKAHMQFDDSSFPSFMLEGYVSGLKNVAKKQTDGTQSAIYYDLAVKALEFLNPQVQFVDYFSYKTETYLRYKTLSQEFYSDYVEVLTALNRLEGQTDERVSSLNRAEKGKEKAPPLIELEKPLCVNGVTRQFKN